jgi:hypothetical protein
MQEVRASQTDADLRMIAEMDDALARIALATTPAGELSVELGGLCRRLRYHRSSPHHGTGSLINHRVHPMGVALPLTPHP